MLDERAFVGGDLAFSISPKANSLGGYAKSPGELGDTAKQVDCGFDWIHARNSTLVELNNLQVCLPCFLHLFSLAPNGNR